MSSARSLIKISDTTRVKEAKKLLTARPAISQPIKNKFEHCSKFWIKILKKHLRTWFKIIAQKLIFNYFLYAPHLLTFIKVISQSAKHELPAYNNPKNSRASQLEINPIEHTT